MLRGCWHLYWVCTSCLWRKSDADMRLGKWKQSMLQSVRGALNSVVICSVPRHTSRKRRRWPTLMLLSRCLPHSTAARKSESTLRQQIADAAAECKFAVSQTDRLRFGWVAGGKGRMKRVFWKRRLFSIRLSLKTEMLGRVRWLHHLARRPSTKAKISVTVIFLCGIQVVSDTW